MKKQITLQEVIQILDKELFKKKEFFSKFDFIVGISRGGLIPAAWIATHLNKPLVTAYINREDEVFADRIEWLTGKNVLLVDDTIRSGKTMNKIVDLLSGNCTLQTFCIMRDPENEISFPWDIYEE